MTLPPSRFVITEKRARSWRRPLLWLLFWLISLAAAWHGGARLAWPDLPLPPPSDEQIEAASAHQATQQQLQQENETLQQRITTLERAAEVDREAARALQATLAERNEELAALRNDVAFYERLAGGGTQRQPLAVHSLHFQQAGTGGWRYVLTLTQNLKKAVVTKGSFTLAVEGMRNGKLHTLPWSELKQKQNAPARSFSFKYFQQIEGSIVLPQGFTPHRVHVSLKSDQGKIEQVVPWTDEAPPAQSSPSSQGAS